MHRDYSSFIRLFFATTLMVLFSFSASAGKVYKVKGKKVYIKLSKKERGNVMKGDKLFIMSKGKKKAVVKVRKILKKGKILAKKIKGKVKKGYRSKMRRSKSSSSSSSVVMEDRSKSRPDLSIGLVGAYGLATQEVNQGQATPSTQTGTMLGGKLLVDYALFNDIGVRAHVGAESFSVAGQGFNFITAGSTIEDIETTITYLSIDILLRYRIPVTNAFFGYLNAGVGILSPISKESTSLDIESVETTSIVIAGGGIGMNFGNTDVFVGADYYYFPPSEDVDTNAISIKFGFMLGF